MRPVIIDAARFDQDKPGDATRMVYRFNTRQLNEPLQTIRAFANNPSTFRDGDYEVVLTRKQNDRLLAYLKEGVFRCDPFAREEPPDYLLAFSFGENADVNAPLALLVQEALQESPSLQAVLQWEIADRVNREDKALQHRVRRIGLNHNENYITSEQVVTRFKMITGDRKTPPHLFLVCQAWHAPRCIQLCENAGLRIVRGGFVDAFSPNDPQEWVRTWLAWLVKEATK